MLEYRPARAGYIPSHIIYHSCPQRPQSFWSAPRIGTSGWNQFFENTQSTCFTFSPNGICQIWQRVCESLTASVGASQRSWFLVLTKRITASGNENAIFCTFCLITSLTHRSSKCAFRIDSKRITTYHHLFKHACRTQLEQRDTKPWVQCITAVQELLFYAMVCTMTIVFNIY